MADIPPLLLLVAALILWASAHGRRRRYRKRSRSRGGPGWTFPKWLVPRMFRKRPSEPTTCGVYVLSNPAFNGLLKIGYTRRHVSRRIAELSRPTGVPHPFELVAFFPTSRPERDEARVHQALRERRVSGKEFFSCTDREAVACCQRIVGDGFRVKSLR